MNYIKGSDFKLENTSVTLGKFDGIHLGHRKLIRKVIEDKSLNSVFFTFDLNPLNLFSEKEVKLIYTNEERISLLEESGLDFVIDFPFTTETANLSPESFIEDVLYKKLGTKKIVVGSDFRFGKNRAGDVELLKEMSKKYDYTLVVIEKKEYDGEEISSTKIRSLLKEGEIVKANYLLGTPFRIVGEVVHGRKLGHKVGMPTINLKPPTSKLLPPFGVYASFTEIDGVWIRGITNIGVKPTVGESFVGVETLLFDFCQNVYGKIVKVCLLEFIRQEMKFHSLEEVKEQVDLDSVTAKTICEKYSMEVE